MSVIMALRQKVRDFTEDVRQANRELGRFSSAIYGLIGLFRILGLPQKLDEALRSLQQIVAMANMARMAIMQLYTATGPVGWFLAGVSTVGTGATFADQAMRELRSYG